MSWIRKKERNKLAGRSKGGILSEKKGTREDSDLEMTVSAACVVVPNPTSLVQMELIWPWVICDEFNY